MKIAKTVHSESLHQTYLSVDSVELAIDPSGANLPAVREPLTDGGRRRLLVRSRCLANQIRVFREAVGKQVEQT